MELNKKTRQEYDIKVKFSDLSLPLKIAIVISWLVLAIWGYSLFIGI